MAKKVYQKELREIEKMGETRKEMEKKASSSSSNNNNNNKNNNNNNPHFTHATHSRSLGRTPYTENVRTLGRPACRLRRRRARRSDYMHISCSDDLALLAAIYTPCQLG